MKIGFIGAGKVGQSLGLLLRDQGYTLAGFYTRQANGLQLDQRLSPVKLYSDLTKIIEDSDVIGITVPDDQIDMVISEIALLPLDVTHKHYFHTSGAHSIESMKILGNHIFSMHPLMAFPTVVDDVNRFKDIYFGIENLSAFIETGLDQVIMHYIEIQSEQKAKYHAAAAIVSNYLVAVIDFGLSQFMDLGIEPNEAQKALWPLIMNTIENVNQLGTKSALTGPIVRGDIGTIGAHISALNKVDLQLYKSIGRYTLHMTNHQESIQKKLEKLLEEDDYDKVHNINF